MSTFLALAQRLRQEALGAGTSALPTAVTSQTGQLKGFVDRIASAWRHIQGLSTEWRWMKRECSYTVSANDNTIVYSDFTDVLNATVISDFARWITEPRTWTAYLSATGQSDEQDLHWLDFNSWRYLYDRGAGASTTGRPFHYAIAPNNYLKLGPKPSASYVLRGWYQQAPVTLTADDSTPAMPAQHHEIIVWYALWMYGMDTSAPEKVAQGESTYKTMLAALERDQLPRIRLAGPIA